MISTTLCDWLMLFGQLGYFLAMFLCFILLGNVLAGLGMSAGPVYYGHVTGDHERYAELVRYLSFSAGLPHSAHDTQTFLWSSFTSGRIGLGTGISAFPSLHVALTTLFALAGWQVDRGLGVTLTIYWLVILVGSVHLGWHYSVDSYVATVCAAAIWGLAGRLQRRSGANRPRPTALCAPNSALDQSA